MKAKKIAVLGSTGSIGTQTLDVIRMHSDRFKVQSVAARSNLELISKQIKEFTPEKAFISNKDLACVLRARFPDIFVLSGEDGLCMLAQDREVDTVVNAIVGASGLIPSLCAVRAGKRLCTANKESLVMAGEILMSLAGQTGSKIIPIDSEHSALLQAMLSGSHSEISRLILTASGGPFFGKDVDYDTLKPEQALNHPNWSMGPRISIDSATMMNKALEVIEAHWLFDIPSEKIDVVIHPQSIIHSIVEFVDGSQIAQMSIPDMKLPIQYALTYPERLESTINALNLEDLEKLTFYPADRETFPALELAFKALEIGGTASAILNAADEIAVNAFLNGKIRFSEITSLVQECMNSIKIIHRISLEDILDADRTARDWMEERIKEQAR